MIIANEFTLSVPVDKAWDLLSDMEQVVPLMPGASLLGREGDDFLAKVKVKVGPVTSEFSGKAHFLEKDDVNHRALIDGRAKDSRGGGNAAAVITLQAQEAGANTRVTVNTDLKIVGKLAQFGSGMLQQVSEKLLAQFVDQLETTLRGGPEPVAVAETTTATWLPRSTSRFTRVATWRMRSMSATEVPPNFIVIFAIRLICPARCGGLHRRGCTPAQPERIRAPKPENRHEIQDLPRRRAARHHQGGQ